MGRIIEAVKAFLADKTWRWQQTDEMTIGGIICGDSARWEWYACDEGEDGLLRFHSVCPILVPKERRHAAAEFLTRVNYGQMLGSFEMDFADGEVRCRTSLPLEPGTPPGPSQVQDIFYTNFALMDRYLPALLAVTYGKITPRRAIRDIESAKTEAKEEPEEDPAPHRIPSPPCEN